MNRTHILATTTPHTPQHKPATKTEIDAFYDAHGHEVFARVFRLRRWFHALTTRPARSAAPRPGFAPLAPNR